MRALEGTSAAVVDTLDMHAPETANLEISKSVPLQNCLQGIDH